ncbi:MAG: ACP phosphodiesterase [Chitinophagaceae bacterium]
MNFLAHAFLSFNHPQVMVGNMISDFVKGKTQYSYPKQIHEGIKLHRHIDTFTDQHDATKQAKKVFAPAYRLYSGAIVDIVYDHFLANDRLLFPNNELDIFSKNVYLNMEQHHMHLPQKFLLMLPYMRSQNWLYNYHTKEGIDRSLYGLVRRSAYLTDHTTAFNLFNNNYDTLQNNYNIFFGDVKSFAKQQFDNLDL